MRSKDMRDLDIEELVAKTAELRNELFNARIRKATGQLENTAKLVLLRRDIARAETILRERRGAAE
jgi:large subunit ribosomal protein L29